MKRWYVIQVYAGYEEAFKKDLDKRIAEINNNDWFGQVLVPSAKTKTVFAATEEAPEEERLFPGYVLIEMEKCPETMSIVSSIMRFTKFLGGKDPAPLQKQEVARILSQVSGEVCVSSNEKQEFAVGTEVEINEGPFAGFVGIIDTINEESEKITVMVSIFGRLTPVELGFDQVKK